MKNYKITVKLDLPEYNGEHTFTSYGYGEQSAVAQLFLQLAHYGAREIKVLDIIETN